MPVVTNLDAAVPPAAIAREEAPLAFIRKTLGSDTVREGRARVAGDLGLGSERVGALVADFTLLRRGVFLDVDARGLGATGARALDWGDFGLPAPAMEQVHLRPPAVTLVPDRYRLPLLRAAARAHALLEELGYSIRAANLLTGAGSGYRWVPAQALPAFAGRFAAIQADFRRERDRLAGDYDAVREAVAGDVVRQAALFARRLDEAGAAQGGIAPAAAESAPDVGALTTVRRRFLDRYPARAAFAGLDLVYEVAAFFLGPDLERQIAEQEESRAARRRAEHEAALLTLEERLRAEQLQRQLWADERLIAERLAAERRRLAAQEAAEAATLRLNLEAVRRATDERIAPLVQAMDRDLDELARLTEEVVATIARRGHLPGASRKRFLDFLAVLRTRALWLQGADAASFEGRLAAAEELLRERPRRKRRPGPSGDGDAHASSLKAALDSLHNEVVGDAREALTTSRLTMLEL